MNRITAFLAALMILLIGGLVHGLHAERWRKSEELSEAVERLINVPLDLGGWLGTDLEVNVDEYAQAGASAYISRVYRKNNQEMQVILMVGLRGSDGGSHARSLLSGRRFRTLWRAHGPYASQGIGGTAGHSMVARFSQARRRDHAFATVLVLE